MSSLVELQAIAASQRFLQNVMLPIHPLQHPVPTFLPMSVPSVKLKYVGNSDLMFSFPGQPLVPYGLLQTIRQDFLPGQIKKLVSLLFETKQSKITSRYHLN